MSDASSPERLFAPVDIASVVFFRVCFGAIMAWEALRYFGHGWIPRYYIEPTFYFTYWGFDWVRPWPGAGMYVHFAVLGVLALFIMAGLWYRIATVLFFLGFTFVFLLDRANYLNHFYLIGLVGFLLIFLPLNRAFSVDAVRRPSLRSSTTPAWVLWLLRFQIGLVYFFGGIAKLNRDWLRGEPMRSWLASRADLPIVGDLFTHEATVWFFTGGGLLLDLLAPFLLLARKTRPFAFAAVVAFHLLNAVLFRIGVFPWLMLGATLVFFDPDWPRRVIARFRRVPPPAAEPPRGPEPPARGVRRALVAFGLGLWVAFQVLVPLRHWLYPGYVSWTEEGHDFSWHMKLRDKQPRIRVIATSPSLEQSWTIGPLEYLSARQARKMPARPRMVMQFCRHVADDFRRRGFDDVEVRADVRVSLNGREPQPMIDPSVDLSKVADTLGPKPWILPLAD